MAVVGCCAQVTAELQSATETVVAASMVNNFRNDGGAGMALF